MNQFTGFLFYILAKNSKMRRLLFTLLLLISTTLFAQEENKKAALILIDIQNFYYPGGAFELHNPKEAGINAQKILYYFRETNQLVVHIRHNFDAGGEIHSDVAPIEGEKVISKDEVNAFNGTDLLSYLKEHKITDIVLLGMQTHMCLEAATRAASDYNFKCTVIEDACTTKDLTFGDKTIKAEDVHYSTMITLKSYANITTMLNYLSEK